MIARHLKNGRIESVAFVPGGRGVAVPRTLDGVHVWDDATAADPPRVLPRGVDTTHGRLRVSADGRRACCRGWFRPVVVELDGSGTIPIDSDYHGRENHAALVPAGDAVVFTQSRPAVRAGSVRVTLVSLRPVADPRPEADRWKLDLDRWVWDAAAFLPGGAFVLPELAALPRRPWLEPRWVVRDLTTGRERCASPPLGRQPTQATASPDGRWVAGIHTKHLLAWRPDDPGAAPLVRPNAGKLHFTGMAFHPSGAYLATTSTDATVRVYETAGWEVVRTYAWAIGKLRCVDFSPDGLLAAVGSETGNLLVWDVDV